ncbi:MAG TPA: hypothetical protein VFZ83_08290 [Acidimicrobiia bacterium]|nr:hypothetical protein [Acidimicrobiia bacterium]
MVLAEPEESLEVVDPASALGLRALAGAVRPAVLARARVLELTGPLAEVLGGSLRRGSVLALDGPLGAGVTSVVGALAAEVTARGEWAAVLDDGTFGGAAAAEAGVVTERLAVVRSTAADRWPTVVAALLDGMTLVAGSVPARLRVGDARRLVARARERGAVLVPIGTWPVEAAVRVHVLGSDWVGLAPGAGMLRTRRWRVHVEGKGAGAHRGHAVHAVAG